jgi:hypothetical protein
MANAIYLAAFSVVLATGAFLSDLTFLLAFFRTAGLVLLAEVAAGAVEVLVAGPAAKAGATEAAIIAAIISDVILDMVNSFVLEQCVYA